ncbi:MAG: hypothetical protein KDD63_13285, partial [Bacteroidetes bacterium]|nr:hypothetical protein [Bacteroidota bacterium]
MSEPLEMDFSAMRELFHIPPAMGRMLFEDEDLWTNPFKRKENPDEKPTIQLIYYAGQLIGGTSPYSLVFTSVDYTGLPQASDMPWYRNGAFVDPIPFIERNNDQLQKLYLLIRNMNENFEEFERNINLNREGRTSLAFPGFKDFLRKWQVEIRQAGNNIVHEGTLDAVLNFSEPFFSLFNVKQSLYFYQDGRVSFKLKPGENPIEVDPKDILLQEDYIIEFVEEDDKQPLRQSAIHYLAVHNPGFNPREPELESEFLYFPIPLSEKGLLLFKNQIGDLIGSGKEDNHELRCYIKPSDFKLVVELHLVIDDKKMNLTAREYELQPLENDRRVIMWPNFISEDWNSYYLYSEFPKADRGTKMVPFFKNASDQSILVNDKGRIIYADSDGIRGSDLSLEQLIAYPGGTLDSSFHKYDIIKTNKPVAGLEIRKNIDGEERVVGYLFVKKPEDDSMGDYKIRDLSRVSSFTDVVLGIDFGSNNSSMYFARVNGSDVKPISFSNRRMVLVGKENLDPDHLKIAMPHELYFFQNESSPNGQVKSWVHEHNPQYIVSGMDDQEIAGGVPVFEPNIHIKNMGSRTITTNAGTLHHSMKWLTEENDKAKKSAYLKALYLKACADLYANNFRPIELRWSFPGSFTQGEVLQYRLLYKDIVDTLKPIDSVKTVLNEDALTESEAVSNYALATGVSLQENNLFLGIDVGGSTSDILLIALDLHEGNYKLVKQSSLRMAAGMIADASRNSKAFRDSLVNYHDSPKSNLTIPNIKTINNENAPFFLNAVFDRLKNDEFDNFYAFLARSNSSLFALPAYMTGLLVFYSGQLVKKTIAENPMLDEVKKINLFPFGKGGRIFDWLDTYPGKMMAEEYLNKCFQAGFGEGGGNMTLFKQDDIREDNKSEVAKGMVSASQDERVK